MENMGLTTAISVSSLLTQSSDWRTIKYEDIYLWDYASVIEACEGIRRYLNFNNDLRATQAIDYFTPAEVYGADPM